MGKDTLDQLKEGLVVSCQALEDEPLHSSFIMSRMALAAKQGGAVGIRANTKKDILEIQQAVDLPVIGIVKRIYPDSVVYITPTLKEVEELVTTGCEIIATDATSRLRPNQTNLEEFVSAIRKNYQGVILMGDISTTQEAINAEQLGFDCVSTTLIGYTEETKGQKLYDHDFRLLKEIINSVSVPVIAEGNILTPEMAVRCLELGAHAVVVGSAITRPQKITKMFTDAINKLKSRG